MIVGNIRLLNSSLKSIDESLVGLLHLMDGKTLDDKNAVYIMGI